MCMCSLVLYYHCCTIRVTLCGFCALCGVCVNVLHVLLCLKGKNFHLFGRSFCCGGVTGGVSDLSRGAGVRIVWRDGVFGVG